MRLAQSFDVEAPRDRVWAALTDIERVAPCLPGAELTGNDGDGVFRGTFSVKLGPATASYRGTLAMKSLDQESHVATMVASGDDKRGQGSAKATIVSRLATRGEATRVEVETEFTITGRLARFGRSAMILDVSNRLLRDFASCLQAQLAVPPAGIGTATAQPSASGGLDRGTSNPQADSAVAARRLNGLSLAWDVLRGFLRRLFRRGP